MPSTRLGFAEMGNMATSELGRRIIAGLEQVANDPKATPAKRREAARRLAEWRRAA